MLRGTAMLGAGAAFMQPLPLWAQSGTMTDVRKAAEAGKDASIKRLRDWIALCYTPQTQREPQQQLANMINMVSGFF